MTKKVTESKKSKSVETPSPSSTIEVTARSKKNSRKLAVNDHEADEPIDESTEDSPKKKSERYFKRIDPVTLESTGRYIGDPEQAASKSFTKMLFKMKKAGLKLPKKQVICLRESTRGSPKKLYCYQVVRLKLDEPQVLKVVNPQNNEVKVINYCYRNKLKKVEIPETLKSLKEPKIKKNKQVEVEENV